MKPAHVGWVRNPIDRFILAALEHKNLTPAPEAGKRTLIRRLSFDLTGLPPKPEDVDAFLNDRAPDAYEKLVDSAAGQPALRRAMGQALARPGALCRDGRP